MLTWKDSLIAKENRKVWLARAEEKRQINRYKSSDFSVLKSYERWLFHLGTQLVRLGCRLQARYPKVVQRRMAGIGSSKLTLLESATSQNC